MQSKTAISEETSPRLGSKKPQSSCGGRSRALCASFFRGSEKDLEAQLGRLVLYARGRGLNIYPSRIRGRLWTQWTSSQAAKALCGRAGAANGRAPLGLLLSPQSNRDGSQADPPPQR